MSRIFWNILVGMSGTFYRSCSRRITQLHGFAGNWKVHYVALEASVLTVYKPPHCTHLDIPPQHKQHTHSLLPLLFCKYNLSLQRPRCHSLTTGYGPTQRYQLRPLAINHCGTAPINVSRHGPSFLVKHQRLLVKRIPQLLGEAASW